MLPTIVSVVRKSLSVVAIVAAAIAAVDLPGAYRFQHTYMDTDQVAYDWLLLTGSIVLWFWLSGRRTRLYAKLKRDYNRWVEK
jgi:hypothetical protein